MNIGRVEGLPVSTITCTDYRGVSDMDKVYISMMSTGIFTELYTIRGKWPIDGNYIVKIKAMSTTYKLKDL